MKRFVFAAIVTGILFATMDGLINGNPYAASLMECFKPIAKPSVNMIAGLVADLLYGIVISGIFIVLRPSIPGQNYLIKGLMYGLGIWFFRVVMLVISYSLMFRIPSETLIYLLVTGLFEMLILGLVNGLILKK